MELFVTHSIKLVTKSVYFLIFIYFSVEMWKERDFSRQQTAGPANHLFVLVLFYCLGWQFCQGKSSCSRNLGKPYEHSGHELYFLDLLKKRTPSRHFQPEWQTLFLVVKKWMQHLKDLLPCWLPLRYTRWQLAKISRLFCPFPRDRYAVLRFHIVWWSLFQGTSTKSS